MGSTAESCPSCGAESAAAAKFCPSCGTALVSTCPSCGSEIRVSAQFCATCGHRLDRAAPKEEERKLVTVLFADLTGSTALGERLDPERLRVLLREYFGAMASVIESWDGKVEKFIGDAVMAVFGIPTTHEEDPERALGAALDMQRRLRELNPALAARHGVQLAVRIGVDTGEVIAGTGGDQLMVTGDVVNVAARLQQTAEAGEVVVGERTYLATRDSFRFEPLAAKALKGKSLPVPAWQVLDQAALVRPRGVPGIATRLVGRQRELSLLETLYRAAVEEGRPRLVTILGPAGIGKTRLTEEFVATIDAGEEPPAVYRGRCLPYGEGITYWPLREVLWSAAGILLDDPAAVAGEKLETFVRGLLDGAARDFSDAERVVFAVAKTAGIALADNPLERMSPESIGEELALAWPRLVSALATDRPVLLLVEDLHRGEPPLLDMLEYLVSRSSGPVLMVATGRPELAEMRPAWTTRPTMSQIGLEPLTEAQSAELVEELLPAVGSKLRERVLAAAEGNPFFAEEIVRHLIDEGVLVRSGSGIVEAGPEAPTVTLPDTVRALLAARVDALPPEEKRTLQDAAVVGRVFWTTTLESMRPGGEIRPALRALEDKGLVVTRQTSSLPGHTELSFHHGLTRDVAYESIPKGRRARVHADVGRWIERLAGDRRAEYVDLIAHHYEKAAEPEGAELAWPDERSVREELRAQATRALLEAGHAARTRFVIDQALGFGDRALALARSEPERLAGLELKAKAADAGVRPSEAWRWYLEALELAEQTGDSQASSRLRAHVTLFWSRYAGAFRGEDWKSQAADIVDRGLEELGDDAVTFETGALLTGRAGFRGAGVIPRGRHEARADAERAVEIGETIGSPYLLSHALDQLAHLLSEDGFGESVELAERMLQAAERMDDRGEAHDILVEAARFLAAAGRFEEAEQVARRAASEALGLGSHRRLHAAFAQTVCLLPAGRLAELLDATSHVPELVLEEGGRTCPKGIMALAGSAAARFEAEDRSGAASAVQLLDAAGIELPLASPMQYRVTEVLRPLLGLEQTCERLERLDTPETTITRIYRLRSETQLRALRGEWHEFWQLVEEARALSGPACAPFLDWIADWGESVHLATAGNPREAVARATKAASALEAYGERYTACRLLVDLLRFLDREGAREIAPKTARRLETMGAFASAGEARRAEARR